MTVNARQALQHFVSALEIHFEAVESRRGPEDAAVDDAYETVASAFEQYEEALETEFDESLPLVLDDADDLDEADDLADDLDDDSDEDDDLEDIEEFDLNSSDT